MEGGPQNVDLVKSVSTDGRKSEHHNLSPLEEQKRRIEETLAKVIEDDSIKTPFDACLRSLLVMLNWTGETRRLVEAHPHLEPVEDIETMAAVLIRLGYKTKPVRMSLNELRQEQLPCIALLDDDQPSMVISIEMDGSFLIFDGQDQTFRIHPADSKVATICLVSQISRPEQKQEENRNSTWFWNALRHFKKSIVAIIVLTFFANVLALATPIYVMNVYNSVIGTGTSNTLYYFLAAILAVFLLEIYLRILRGKLIAYFGARFDASLLNAGVERILSLPITMTESASVGSQVTRLRQFESILGFFTGHLVSAILDLPFTLLFFAVIALISGTLAWVPIGLAVIFAVMAIISVPVTKRNVAESGSTRSLSQNFLMETLAKSTTLRQLNIEDGWLSRFTDMSNQYVSRKLRAHFFDNCLHTIAQSFVMLAGIITLWLGADMVISGELSIGALIALMMLVWRVLSPIQVIFLSLNRIGQFAASVTQINRLMALQPERSLSSMPTLFRTYDGNIQIDGVGFRYALQSMPILRSVSFNAKPGEIVAITGDIGSGKSTLLKMVIGLYQPQAGAIYLDGLNLKQLDFGEVRAAIGYAPEEPIFFYGTVAQNIRLACPTASDQDILEALEDAGLDIDSDIFSDGLNTRLTGQVLGDMTEGVLQRLSLARAYAKKAPIYLFDEPGTFLDRDGDVAFVQKLKALRGQATVLVATNRPSHMRACDRVSVLRDGMILADGKPDEILAALAAERDSKNEGSSD